MRKTVQAVWGIVTNSYLKGFAEGKIYNGALKKFCVPGMNCYSCPAALGACPIGALQAVFGGRHGKFAFYVIGWLAMAGLIAGRFVCGWLCLFGLFQELLYKIPLPKTNVPDRLDKALRYLKYIMLFLLVIILPFALHGEPYFCKFVCPVGTLEGGIPLVMLNKGLRSAIGVLFKLKFFLLVLCIISSVFIYRPFCRYICPLGAFYALFQRVSFIRMSFDGEKCIHCGACARACQMKVDPVKTPNSCECIRCGECVSACPKSALGLGICKGSDKIIAEQE